MTVAENIMLGRWPSRFGVISKRKQFDRARQVLAQVAPGLSPYELARRLSPAEGQLVEIARAIAEDSRVLVMDEPTTSLSGREIDQLSGSSASSRSRGWASFSSPTGWRRFFAISDRVTVLRDGRLVGSKLAAELDPDKVIKMMVGRTVQEVTTTHRPAGRGSVGRAQPDAHGRAPRRVVECPGRRDRQPLRARRSRPQRNGELHLRCRRV
jgi:ABC-type sugar transport system ATPase subunit